MAVVGGMLASALLKVVTQQIGCAISGQIRLQGDFSEDFRRMKATLESLEAVLNDAERRSIQDAAVRLWLKRLTDAMYCISDMFDKFEADTQPAGQKVGSPHFSSSPIAFHFIWTIYGTRKVLL
jgi:hypothetical protein